MGQIISVVSGKGGVGKTTLSVALACHLTAMGHPTLLVDTDWGMCSAGYLLESGRNAVYTLQDVLSQRVSFFEAIVQEKGCPDFLATANAPVVSQELVLFTGLLKRAAEEYDYIVLDRPAGLDVSLEQTLGKVLPLVVCTPDPMSVHGAHAMVEALTSAQCPQGRLVVNRFVPSLVQKKMAANLEALCDEVGLGLVGIIPLDDRAATDALQGKGHLAAPYQKAIDRIARRLTGESVPLPNLKKLLKS